MQQQIDDAMRRKGISSHALARVLGVTPEAVRLYRLGKRRIPAERVLEIERITGVPRHALRPDIYPEPKSASGSETLATDGVRSR